MRGLRSTIAEAAMTRWLAFEIAPAALTTASLEHAVEGPVFRRRRGHLEHTARSDL